MDKPLVWSNLDQAAEWLSHKTQSKWDREKIISFAIESYEDENSAISKSHKAKNYKIVDGKRKYKTRPVFSKENLSITHLPPSPTYLSVKFPRSVAVSLYRHQADVNDPIPVSYEIIAGGLVRVFKSEIRFAPLYPKHLKDIFLDDKTVINQPKIEFISNLGWEYTLFDPPKLLTHGEIMRFESLSRACHGYIPHSSIAEIGAIRYVTADMVGIDKQNLEKLLSDYTAAGHSTEEIGLTSRDHTTHEMVMLRKANEKFWVNHDPNRPPKKGEVVSYLVENGISKSIAESMDTMMRPKEARKGGQKPRILKT